MAAEIKRHVSIPVLAVANIKEPDVAEAILQEGCCDLVGVGEMAAREGVVEDPVMATSHAPPRPEVDEVYMSSRTPTHIAEAAESLADYRDRVHAQVLDVREEKAVAEYMAYVAARGRVDYLFCNAGVGFGQPYCGVTMREDWNTIFDVNVFGLVNCVHHMLPHLVKQGSGHIVMTFSVAGITPLPYQSLYVASKHAVYGFARCLRYELEDKNIKVSVVCPGAVATNIFHRALDYSLHFELPTPPDAIGIDQAGAEILEGILSGQDVIPVNEDARGLYRAIRAGDYDYVERVMQVVKERAVAAVHIDKGVAAGRLTSVGRE